MSAPEMMPGPDGSDVRCYRRGVRQLSAGDWLPEHGAHIVGAPIEDPDTGRYWVTLEDGTDVELRTRKVWVHRRYQSPDWVRDAVDAYRAARDAREAVRQSGAPIPAGAVAGAAGSLVCWAQLEDDDFAAAYPAPRLADYLRDAAAARRDPAA